MKKHRILMGTLLMSLFLLASCAKIPKTNDKLQVIATFYPMLEFTKQVVGEEADVQLLIPAGMEMHDYEPSAKDVATLSQADAVVYNSNELETWMDAIDSIKATNKIEAAKGISLIEGAGENHDHEGEQADARGHAHSHDPHVWTNPVMAIQEVETIRDQLSEKFPEKKDRFFQNAATYIKQLEELDQEYQEAFTPAKNKTFVTQHAAFSYLAKQYGLSQESIAGLSPEIEPTPARVAELSKFVKDHEVKVIYFEENASSKIAETLAKETGVTLAVLNPLESLTDKQLAAGESYVSIMKENLVQLKKSIH